MCPVAQGVNSHCAATHRLRSNLLRGTAGRRYSWSAFPSQGIGAKTRLTTLPRALSRSAFSAALAVVPRDSGIDDDPLGPAGAEDRGPGVVSRQVGAERERISEYQHVASLFRPGEIALHAEALPVAGDAIGHRVHDGEERARRGWQVAEDFGAVRPDRRSLQDGNVRQRSIDVLGHDTIAEAPRARLRKKARQWAPIGASPVTLA